MTALSVRFCSVTTGRPTPDLETAELLNHKIRPELIVPYWDELLRLAASLRHGWAPASLLLTRLQAGSRRNPLAQALQEYGRLIKTNFILAWLADQELFWLHSPGRAGHELRAPRVRRVRNISRYP